MGTGTVPPDLIVTPSQLSRNGVPSAFLTQFQPQPFQIVITTGGVLGTMQFAWQRTNDAALSLPIVSGAGATWPYTIDDVQADVIFAAATYVLNAVYSVDAVGAVTPGGPVTVTLFDLRQVVCSAVTTEALKKMKNAIRQPLKAWGDDASMHAAAWAYALLKRSKGATPEGAGAGDQNVFLAEKQAQDFFDGIGREGKPASMTDTSVGDAGDLIPVPPFGDGLRGW